MNKNSVNEYKKFLINYIFRLFKKGKKISDKCFIEFFLIQLIVFHEEPLVFLVVRRNFCSLLGRI